MLPHMYKFWPPIPAMYRANSTLTVLLSLFFFNGCKHWQTQYNCKTQTQQPPVLDVHNTPDHDNKPQQLLSLSANQVKKLLLREAKPESRASS